jgi:pimeloyl-ACP methyl ester carboxylesterase
MPTFTRGSTTIYYETHGSGQPVLVFAPGGMQSEIARLARSPWHPVAELSDQFRVITMDQRNAGASRAAVSAQDGWHTYTEDHLALLDELKVERCHVLGICIGGAFALSLIAAAPERVSAAVLQQPIGFDGTNRGVFYELFDTWAAQLLTEGTDIAAGALAPFRERMYGGDFVFSVPRAAVARCAVPLLVLRGNDVYHPAPISQEIVHLAPRAELVHDWKTGEDLSRAVARVRSFLAEH